MKNIYNEFINGLEQKYQSSDEQLKEKYNSFIETKKGITEEELNDLKKEYPNIPESLIKLLKYSNGIDIYCFNSDVDEGNYPYYLNNSIKMIESKNDVINYYSDFIERSYDDAETDIKITNDLDNVNWLLFSNCMNDGGTSQLFIDFTPSKEGKVGQIVRYLHDPDSMVVIADSFDEFLKQIIDSNYKFIDAEMKLNKEEPKSIKNTKKSHKTSKNNLFASTLILLTGIISFIIGLLFITSNLIIGIVTLIIGLLLIFLSFKTKRK